MTLVRIGILLLLGSGSVPTGQTKYVEGHLKTSDNWAFLARFCFLSGRGRYEYLIEYEKKLGELKLLLYYDDRTQWPAIYKTDKTCTEKLSVLHPEDNQIVTLSPRTPYNLYSGCFLRTPTPKESPNDPLPKDGGSPSTKHPPSSARPGSSGGDIRPPDDDAQYFDQFLKTSTYEPEFAFDERYEPDNGTEDGVAYELFHTSTMATGEGEAAGGYAGDNGAVNLLENTTDYRSLVEQLFPDGEGKSALWQEESVANGTIRERRAAPGTSESARYKDRLIVSCSNFGSFTSSRERWWYIAIANCDGSGRGLDVKYRFRMTNGPPGDFWHEHFSADEMYIPPILMTESISYSMLLLAVFICAVELKARHLYHCTYRLFTLSVLLQWFGVLLLSVTWTKYAVSGIGPFPNFGGIFTSASEITFLLLLLLMAKGYTITRARLKTCATVKITIFINLYVVVYITLYIYQAEAFDPGEVLNLYESPAGFGLAGLRCVGWGFFMYSCAATIRKFTEKAPFYYPFTLLGSLWIMSGPVLTLLGVNVLDPWVRESVMHGALGTVAFVGHLAFLWLTWPSRANKSFPYHVRTNHVGVSLGEDDEATYPKHTYEPTATMVAQLHNHHQHHHHHQDGVPNGNGFMIPVARSTVPGALDGLYDQYLRERDVYHSTSTPLSYVSFPNAPRHPATNGAPISTISNGGYRNGVIGSPPVERESMDRPTGDAVTSRSETSVTGNDREATPAIRHSLALEPEHDPSGHSSLEIARLTPVAASNGSVPSSSSAGQPSVNGSLAADANGGIGALREPEERRPFNPFLAAAADTADRKPNRIILPSLEHAPVTPPSAAGGSEEALVGVPNHSTPEADRTVTAPAVPKHLFAAKPREPIHS
ncbi:uncharacterized protein LOC131285483 [Anopheles ziemanni]|uniref:uncharacterized protein LOC131259085 n=1 Tax=Anopheles coustani TaxID=139045 RepID=UPI00265847FA|nr:uncharacterized protein LOC131259085 [Anopheles coustani]XP_058170324.1 uncharacterized protein LOC131285483 [Anopheles ziemanni]